MFQSKSIDKFTHSFPLSVSNSMHSPTIKSSLDNTQKRNKEKKPIRNQRKKRKNTFLNKIIIKRIYKALTNIKQEQYLTNKKLLFISEFLLSKFTEQKNFDIESFEVCINNTIIKDNINNKENTRSKIEELSEYFAIKLRQNVSLERTKNKKNFLKENNKIKKQRNKFIDNTDGRKNNKFDINNTEIKSPIANHFLISLNKKDLGIKIFRNNNINSNRNSNNSNINLERFKIKRETNESKNIEKTTEKKKIEDKDKDKNKNKDKDKDKEVEIIKINQELFKMKNNINLSYDIENKINASQSDASSISSGIPIVGNSIKGKPKKVRGFNFKNNIKAKKFPKGILVKSVQDISFEKGEDNKSKNLFDLQNYLIKPKEDIKSGNENNEDTINK